MVKQECALKNFYSMSDVRIERMMKLFNPLSPNIADLQHFDIVLFCDLSLQCFLPKYRTFTGSLLVVHLSQGLVKKVG